MKLASFTTVQYTNRIEVEEGNSPGDPVLWRSSEDTMGAGGLEDTYVALNQQREPANQEQSNRVWQFLEPYTDL